MMNQLLPFFRILPPMLFVFGIVMVVANIAELRATASITGMDGSFLTEMRITYLAGLVRSFYDLFYLWAMAAVVAAVMKFGGEK